MVTFFVMTYFVYILYSKSADKYYIGHSPDPSKRLAEHNSYVDTKKFTAKHQPWIMMKQFPVSENRGQAIRIERYIKKQKCRKTIQQIIQSNNNSDFIQNIIRKALQ